MQKQVFLIEEFQRIRHFVEADRPILPALILLFVRNIFTFDKVISPRLADENGIASQCCNKLFILNQDKPVLYGKLVFITMTAFTIDRESPPIIMALVELAIIFFLLPLLKKMTLIQAKVFDQLPLSYFCFNHFYLSKYNLSKFLQFIYLINIKNKKQKSYLQVNINIFKNRDLLNIIHPIKDLTILSYLHYTSILQANKMIKYITERDVDLRQLKSKRKNNSHLNIKLELEAKFAQNQQSFSQAVASYKKNDEVNDQLLKRLNVLRQQQKKMDGRTAQNDSKLEHYKTIREQFQLHRKKSQQYRLELAKEMQVTRSILAHERETQAFKLEQTRRKMYFEKWFNYLDQRENYKTEMNSTRLNFESQLIKKREKSSEIRQMEQEQRRNVSQFHQKKKSAIKLSSLQQRMKLNSMSQSKMDEIQALSHMESLLLSRQARSRMDSQESTGIKSIISYKKSSKHSNNCLSANDIYVI